MLRSGIVEEKLDTPAQPRFRVQHPSDALIEQQCRCLGRCARQE